MEQTKIGIANFCYCGILLDADTAAAPITENDGSATKTRQEQPLSSLHYGTTTIFDIIFTANDYELTQETQPNTQQINFAYSSNKLASISSTLDNQTSQNNIAYDGDLVGTLSDTRTAVDFDYDERHNISQAKIADAVVLSKVITYNNKLRHFLTKKLLTVLTRRRAKCIIILQTKLKLVVWPIEGGRHVLGKFIVAF